MNWNQEIMSSCEVEGIWFISFNNIHGKEAAAACAHILRIQNRVLRI